MEVRPDTSSSSGRFRGQWSFLANPPHHAQQPRSLPPSSYIIHSERSSISPLPTGLNYHTATGSRSSLHRNITTASIGGKSGATVPSQPVLIRVHSADASAHTSPAPRSMRPIALKKNTGLPALSEFSLQGILSAIQEDVEQDINTISEIWGRSRLVLADQHDSHMPPQGEITAMPQSLQAVEEASSSSEQLATDDILILRDDASLINGSQAGSAAYGLLERLQAVPRVDRTSGESPGLSARPRHQSNNRHNTAPAILSSDHISGAQSPRHDAYRPSRNLLRTSVSNDIVTRTTTPLVSETRLLAEADGTTSIARIPSAFDYETTLDLYDSGRGLYEPSRGLSEFSSEIYGDMPGVQHPSFRERMQSMLYVSDPMGFSGWLQGQSQAQSPSQNSHDAEGHLRDLLDRQS